MKKLIIFFFMLFLTSCYNDASNLSEKYIITLIAKSDNASILNMLASGDITLDFQTSKNKFSLLHLAIKYNDLDLVQSLIEQGISMDMVDKEGNTALLFSIIYGNSIMADALIDAQANVDIQNKQGDTALILACKKGMESTILNLIKDTDERINPYIKDGAGQLAINYLIPDSLSFQELTRYMEKYKAHHLQ